MKRRQFVQGVGAASALGMTLGMPAKADAAARPMMPLTAFVDGPLLDEYTLSPDGKKLAMLVNNGDKTTLITRDIATGKTASVIQTDNLESMVLWAIWANDKRLLYSLAFPSVRDPGDNPTFRFKTMETRLFAVDADGSNQINMVKKVLGQAAQRYSGAASIYQDRIIDWLPNDPDHVLLVLEHDDDSAGTAVYKVDVNTAERVLYEPPHQDLDFTCTDANHRVRIGVERDPNKSGSTTWFCDPDGSRWRKLAVDNGPFDGKAITPLGFGLDPNILYVNARVDGIVAVHTMDLREAQPKLVLKLADPEFNLSGSLLHDPNGEAVGIGGVDSGTGSSRFYWDKGYKELQEQIDAALPNRWNFLADISRYNGAYLLSSIVPGLPATLMLGNMSTGRLEALSGQYPKLDTKRIALKKPFDFKARDGFKLHAYLTLPQGSKHEKLPLVVMPHGGPQARDTIAFDPLVAFVADRGYAVLQVNFRGSTGYGWDYMKAGLRRWGLETQDDLTDGVKKLVADGIADPARVAMVGWSFGGYAALWGIIKDPDLYRGAFAIAPVTNLVSVTSDWRSFGHREVIRQQIGDSSEDREQLNATSPVFHAEKIKVPVVMLHGTMDRQADYRQSEQMDAALTRAGKPHKFISFDKADHSLTHRPYRLRMYTELEKFLQEVLGTGAPANA